MRIQYTLPKFKQRQHIVGISLSTGTFYQSCFYATIYPKGNMRIQRGHDAERLKGRETVDTGIQYLLTNP